MGKHTHHCSRTLRFGFDFFIIIKCIHSLKRHNLFQTYAVLTVIGTSDVYLKKNAFYEQMFGMRVYRLEVLLIRLTDNDE